MTANTIFKQRIYVISGERNIGKTLLCLAIKNKIMSGSGIVRGVISPGLYREDAKIGILVLDIASGEQRQLASYEPGWDTSHPERLWRFDDQVLAWGNQKILASVPTDILIIDEIGYLELENNEGWTSAMKVLDDGLFQKAIIVVRPELLEKVYQRWQIADTFIVHSGTDLSNLSTTLLDHFKDEA